MRPDQQNRRSCLVLLGFLAVLVGLIVWLSLGGISSETVGDDVKADMQAPAPKPVAPPTG